VLNRLGIVQVALLTFVLVTSSFSQEVSSAKDPGITHEQADAILNELRQIREYFEQQGQHRPAAPLAPQKQRMKIDSSYTLGGEDAPLTMVEFADYQCPFCREFESTTYNELKSKYIDTGKLRFVSRNLPLAMHPDAMRAAEAAMCAGDQGQYWAIRSILFRQESLLTESALLDYAANLPLDLNTFETCLKNEKHKAQILKDVEAAGLLHIDGTPAFLIGKTTSDGVEGYLTVGAAPFAEIDAKLSASEAGR
jgi:protein-disulfide isomerase